MLDITEKNFQKTLNFLKIKKGDTIFLMFELWRLGKLKGAKNSNQYFNFFLKQIINRIGKKGTLAVNTYTFDNSKYNQNFVYEKKECSSGKISEIFLNFKKVSRSIHPLFSVAAIGKNKNFICKYNSSSNYGSNSPFDRLLKKNCKVLALGINLCQNPFLHCAELNASVPYMYNKIFGQKVLFKKKIIKKDFISFVRYKNLNYEYDFKKIEKILNKKKIIKKAKLGKGYISVCASLSFFNLISETLKKDIHGLLLKKPNYDKKKFPFL